jgi:hypothetical protein
MGLGFLKEQFLPEGLPETQFSDTIGQFPENRNILLYSRKLGGNTLPRQINLLPASNIIITG